MIWGFFIDFRNKILQKLLITGDLGILLDFWIKILRKCSEIKVRCVSQWFINTSQLKYHQRLILKVADIISNFRRLRRAKKTQRHNSSSTFQRSWTIGCWFWNRKNVRMWFSKLSLGFISWWYFWQSNRRRFRSFQISKNLRFGLIFLTYFRCFFDFCKSQK